MDKCVARVSDDHGWRSHQCTRNGKVQRGVDWYCALHDPEARRAKKDAKQLLYTAQTNYKAARSKIVHEAVKWATEGSLGADLQKAVFEFTEAKAECARLEIPGWKLL